MKEEGEKRNPQETRERGSGREMLDDDTVTDLETAGALRCLRKAEKD